MLICVDDLRQIMMLTPRQVHFVLELIIQYQSAMHAFLHTYYVQRIDSLQRMITRKLEWPLRVGVSNIAFPLSWLQIEGEKGQHISQARKWTK